MDPCVFRAGHAPISRCYETTPRKLLRSPRFSRRATRRFRAQRESETESTRGPNHNGGNSYEHLRRRILDEEINEIFEALDKVTAGRGEHWPALDAARYLMFPAVKMLVREEGPEQASKTITMLMSAYVKDIET